jgi:hypothetical protein
VASCRPARISHMLLLLLMLMLLMLLLLMLLNVSPNNAASNIRYLLLYYVR